jgi:CsoR family transcriptional regulator, copper-sensing transcriptional repressor
MRMEAGNGTACGHSRIKERPRHARLKRDLDARLSRAEGQMRGIRRMVAEDAYCIDVLEQVSAVRRALDRAALVLVRDHLETCVSDAIVARRPNDKIRELVTTLDRFLG